MVAARQKVKGDLIIDSNRTKKSGKPKTQMCRKMTRLQEIVPNKREREVEQYDYKALDLCCWRLKNNEGNNGKCNKG
jgi:hypothetical protein